MYETTSMEGASDVLRTTSICDRSALTARVEPPRADCTSQLWVLVLCHTVRASVRGIVWDMLALPASATHVRCSVRGVGQYLWEGCLHGDSVGSHQKSVFPKMTILTPFAGVAFPLRRIWGQC